VDVSAFAVAAFHDAVLPVGATSLDAVIWMRAAGIGAPAIDVSLRLWTPAGVQVTALREVAPGSGDLLARGVHVDDRTSQFSAGQWTDGVREYELAVALPARNAGDAMLAARVSVVVGEEVAGHALVAVTWADRAPPREPAGDLPTGAPSQPYASRGAPAPGDPCRGCGAQPDDGDRYCEACGRELTAP
jgi:hypothetical protein